MKRIVCVVAMAAMAAGSATAQNHPNGYAGGVINWNKTTADQVVLIYDNAGNLTTGATAGLNNCHGLTMDHNNRLLIATDLSWNNSAPSLHKIDPTTGANLGTLGVFQPGDWVRDITVGQNGDYYVTETTRDAVFKVDQAGNISTVAVVGDNPWGGIVTDIDSGDLLVQSGGGMDPIRLIARDGSFVTTIATGFDSRWGLTQDIATGDLWSSSGDTPLRIYHLPAGQMSPNLLTLTTLSNGGPGSFYSVRSDRASEPFRQIIGGSCWTLCTNLVGGLYKLDISLPNQPIVSGAITTLVPRQSDFYDVEILYRRNVHSNLVGRGQWDIGIKIPEDAGLGYLLAVSGTGVRGPGVLTFPSSARTAWLVADSFTFLGLSTGFGPFLVGDKGILDANGEGMARLNLSSFPSGANGLRFWFLALTFDSSAPDGVRTISDPHVIQLEGL